MITDEGHTTNFLAPGHDRRWRYAQARRQARQQIMRRRFRTQVSLHGS
jgi:hypothetical protein